MANVSGLVSRLSAGLLVTSLGVPTALAQDANTTPQVTQQEGSQYARVRFLEGEVSIIPGESSTAPDQMGVNTPILPGDQLRTLEGRAEVQFADGGVLRLDRATSIEAAAVPDLTNRLENRTLLKLSAGSIYLHLLPLDSTDEQVRVDTPTASIYLLSAGVFRIDVAPDGGRVFLSSHTGVAEIVSEGISVLVRSGERSDARPGGAPSNPRPFNGFSGDDFDRWTHDRQGAYAQPSESVPVADVPAEVTPYVSELSSYGNWVEDDSYGWVWAPSVASDWSPYHSGYWYGAPSGWVWVSYEPWGWAPYHYGRWDYASYGWVWIPGSIWAGAWVSWGYYPGYVGWCPLNYYNYPVGYCGYGGCGHSGHGSAHHPWTYVPQGQVASADLQRKAVPKVQLERVASQGVQSGRPPAASPRAAATMKPSQVAVQTPAASRPNGELVSFRTMEGRGQARTEPLRAGVISRGASSSSAAALGRAQTVSARTPGLAQTPPTASGATGSAQRTVPGGSISRQGSTSPSAPTTTRRPSATVPRGTAIAPRSATGAQAGQQATPPRSTGQTPRVSGTAPRASATAPPGRTMRPQGTVTGGAPPATASPVPRRSVPLTAGQVQRGAPRSQAAHTEPRSPILEKIFTQPQGAPARPSTSAPAAPSASPSSGAVQPSGGSRPSAVAPSRGSSPSRGGAAAKGGSGNSGGTRGSGSRGTAKGKG